MFFFFKQKTAYEMRISDWSSDVCSSDLVIEVVALDGHGLLLGSLCGGLDVAQTAGHEDLHDLVGHARSVVERHQVLEGVGLETDQIGRASCRERVCQYG